MNGNRYFAKKKVTYRPFIWFEGDKEPNCAILLSIEEHKRKDKPVNRMKLRNNFLLADGRKAGATKTTRLFRLIVNT